MSAEDEKQRATPMQNVYEGLPHQSFENTHVHIQMTATYDHCKTLVIQLRVLRVSEAITHMLLLTQTPELPSINVP